MADTVDEFFSGFTTTVEECFNIPSLEDDPYKVKDYHFGLLRKRFGECAVRERNISVDRINDSIHPFMKLKTELLVLDKDQFIELIRLMPMELIQAIKTT